MWIARDKNNELVFFTYKPVRGIGKYEGYWVISDDCPSFADFCSLPSRMFPEQTWEMEPAEVEIVPKLYRREDVCIGCHNEECDSCYYKDKFTK